MPTVVRNKDASQEPQTLTGAQKVGVLIVALPQETAAKILKRLPRKVVEAVTREIASLNEVGEAQRREVISEFFHLANACRYADAGGISYARSLLEKSLPPQEARRIIEFVEQSVHRKPFAFLSKTEPENLLTFLREEHPQTIALVMSHLPPSKASDVLAGLSVEKQIEVVRRVANMDQTSPDVIGEVERGLETRLAGFVSESFQRVGGVQLVAEMINLTGRSTEKAIFEGLEPDDPDLVDEIRRLMFVFEDLLRVNDRGIQAILKEVENEELALALRTASEELKQKVFSNMSERASVLIQEEMEFMGPVRVSDVEAAQQKIVEVARRLEDAGEIIIAGKGDSDLVV